MSYCDRIPSNGIGIIDLAGGSREALDDPVLFGQFGLQFMSIAIVEDVVRVC